MTSPAAAQLDRIVQLVAELSRRERAGEPPLSLAEVAAQLGVRPADVERDLRTLTTSAGDSADQDWLASLSVIQEGDRVAVSSQGPFRRPIRLTPEEILAIQVGLADDPDAEPLSHELAALLTPAEGEDQRWAGGELFGPEEAQVAALARHAAAECRCLEIVYAGSGRGAGARVVEVHHVVRAHGHSYLIAWCRSRSGQRHFRADRVLEARLLDETFTPRFLFDDARGGDVFMAPDEQRTEVTVRFTRAISRWLCEQHDEAVPDERGGVTVTYPVADPAWLVRTVLQYGPEAEVVSPPAFRALMRGATAET